MKHLELKYARAEIKAVDPAAGTFEAIVSVFGNVDLGGDRMMPGAFTRTLADWAAKGEPIPVIWSHEWDDPESHIGWVVQAEERPVGLWVKAQLDVEANPRAAYVARLMKQRRVTQFSFGYYATDFKYATEPDGTTVRELLAVDLFEVGPTLLGMNPETQLLQAASRSVRDAKAGRVLSASNEEALTQARDLINEVLAQLDQPAPEAPQPADSGKAGDAEEKAIPEVKVDAPGWMKDNVRQGLDWYEQGLGGDGLVEATIREARQIAAGTVTDGKARKMAAWLARHMVDLDAPAADPENPGYPSPGVVAHALWGGGSKAESERALAWAERRVQQLDNEAGKSVDVDTEIEELPVEDGSRDTPDNMNNVNSEWLYLLTRPKYTEE